MKRILGSLKSFFFPPSTAPVAVRILPLLTIAVVMLLLFVFTTVAWEKTNATAFCGETCHTMPPQYLTHMASYHSRVLCEDCHMGRDVLAVMIPRKIMYSWQTGSAMVTGHYEYPIVARNMRPAIDACENCHKPETFSNDKLVQINHYAEDEANSLTTTYLSLKIGGGTSREGLGYGIHWHVENPIYFYSVDRERQQIPYVVVTNPDGSKTEYIDVESGFDPASIKQEDLQKMDCITCHNRVAHAIEDPATSVNSLISRGLISEQIPFIRKNALEALNKAYAAESEQAAQESVTELSAYYQITYPDFYAANTKLIDDTITALQDQITISKFPDQKVDWQTHPDNNGHVTAPGCFRCHDGQHLTSDGKSVRLECNICHSIPVVSESTQINALLQLNRGYEPESHLNSNWINLHRTVFDETCQSCHTVEDPGGISNVSFCSNSACHGAKYDYAGFNAPGLREVIAAQAAAMATPTPTPKPIDPDDDVDITPAAPAAVPTDPPGMVTWNGTVGPMFKSRCVACHGTNAMGALDLSTFATTMSGGKDGMAVVPGKPEESMLVKIQSGPQKHFGQLNTEELEKVIEWIKAGAPE